MGKYYIRFWGNPTYCLKMQTALLFQFLIVCTLTDSLIIFQYVDCHLTVAALVDILSKYSSSLEIENCHESKRMHAEILCGMESLQVTCNNMSPQNEFWEKIILRMRRHCFIHVLIGHQSILLMCHSIQS